MSYKDIKMESLLTVIPFFILAFFMLKWLLINQFLHVLKQPFITFLLFDFRLILTGQLKKLKLGNIFLCRMTQLEMVLERENIMVVAMKLSRCRKASKPSSGFLSVFVLVNFPWHKHTNKPRTKSYSPDLLSISCVVLYSCLYYSITLYGSQKNLFNVYKQLTVQSWVSDWLPLHNCGDDRCVFQPCAWGRDITTAELYFHSHVFLVCFIHITHTALAVHES